MDDKTRFTLRVPGILLARVQGVVKKRQENEPKFSVNDYVVESLRQRIDGVGYAMQLSGKDREPESVGSAPVSATGRPTAQDLASRYGIKTGATIEEVEPRMDPEAQPGGFQPPPSDPPATAVAIEDDPEAYWHNLIYERFRAKIADAQRKCPGEWKRLKTWEAKYKWLEKKKEQEEGS